MNCHGYPLMEQRDSFLPLSPPRRCARKIVFEIVGESITRPEGQRPNPGLHPSELADKGITDVQGMGEKPCFSPFTGSALIFGVDRSTL